MKQLVNSESLSQRPLTFIPADFVQKLTKPLAALPRNLLSDRARKEYHGKLFTPKSFLFWQHCYSNSSTSDNILYIYIHYRDTTELWDATELGHSPFLLNWSQVLENS